MNVYEISHTLSNQFEYVAADSPAEAVKKLQLEYKEEDCHNSRLNDKDIISITKLGDLVL